MTLVVQNGEKLKLEFEGGECDLITVEAAARFLEKYTDTRHLLVRSFISNLILIEAEKTFNIPRLHIVDRKGQEAFIPMTDLSNMFNSSRKPIAKLVVPTDDNLLIPNGSTWLQTGLGENTYQILYTKPHHELGAVAIGESLTAAFLAAEKTIDALFE